MKKPLISVIVPVYNSEKYLRRCIDSILNQSYSNLEIILIDDGSTDGCKKIIDEYSKKDSRIIAISQKNSGQSHARNVGLAGATGEYVSFIDSDDEIHEDFILELFAVYNNNVDLSVIGMCYRKLDIHKEINTYLKRLRPRGKKESIQNYTLRLLTFDGRMYPVINKLFRTSILKENHLSFEEGLNFAEDTEFVLRYLSCISGEIRFILKPYYIYNGGTINSTSKAENLKKTNWDNSFAYLKAWCGKLNLNGRFWLWLVFMRWRVSYIRSSLRAKKGKL